MKEKVVLRSVGCRTNQEEMAALGNRLLSDGYSLVDKEHQADIIILNTCSVTGHTESKTRRLINSFSKKNPNAKIMLTGCLAQQSPDDLLNSPNVEWVVGNTRKSEIPEILDGSEEGLFYSLFENEEADVADFYDENTDPASSGRTRYSLKIQEGCDFSCSYCIVPSLRGPSRSVKKEKVFEDCKRAIESGFKEVVITGTHIGQYSDGDSYLFPNLIEDLLKIDNNFRIRLSSLDPREFSDELLTLLLKEDRICDHLHISMQSLSNGVLERMNRVYDEFNLFRDRLDIYLKEKPYAALGGDFIVGFPGETEEEFNETASAIKELGFNYGHVFRYSIRPGTTAEVMGDQITDIVKKNRSDTLRDILLESRVKFVEKQLNLRTLRIISEKECPVNGLSSNYIRIEVSDSNLNKNLWIDAKIISYDKNRNICYAELVGSEE